MVNRSSDITPAIDAAIELLDDILSPEVEGHATSNLVRMRAYTVREMLVRHRQRQLALWSASCTDATP